MRWNIHWTEVTGSTNDDAFGLGKKGAEDGTVCAALQQTRGRGRIGREWYSPAGAGLYVSALVRPRLRAEEAGLLSFCAANAMTEAVRRAGGTEAMIKWPNDIVMQGKKICGILSACQAAEGRLDFAVIGTGLNLLPGAYPEELKDKAACLADFGIQADRDALLEDYLEALDQEIREMERDGFEPVRARLAERCVTLGRRVTVSGGQQAEGVATEIGAEGELMLRTDQGETVPVLCGDASVRGIMGYI